MNTSDTHTAEDNQAKLTLAKTNLLADSIVVSVLTCAAPRVNTGERPSDYKLTQLLNDRITGILHVAAAYHYHYLVLGAWGCGAFGNDAELVANIFYWSLRDFCRGAYTHADYFRDVTFAVLDHSYNQYNFKCFEKQFQDFYAYEDAEQIKRDRLTVQRKRQTREPYRDKIQGCLLGGAVGDALGYPVEFLPWHSIQARYGREGIQGHDPDMGTGFALISGRCGSIDKPINDSKGCGGIMRVAPVGLFFDPVSYNGPRTVIDREGAEIAAITHGHPLGYMPAAVLTHIVNVAVYGSCPRGNTLLDAVEDAMDTVEELFGRDPYWAELRTLVNQAEVLAGNTAADVDNIHALGRGWVAEETLAIAVYCALRYPDDFSKGVIAAVNHSGDSDSTGAVTGNILGAWLGSSAIEDKWTRNLELRSIIMEAADDLCYGCPMNEYSSYQDPVWNCKYVFGRYPVRCD